jgi:hypothetical protein
MVAVVFQSCLALFTLFTAVDHTADADQVAHVESRDLIADGGHLADDFMSRHARIERTGPFRSRLMKVGVADAAVIDGNLHIVGPGSRREIAIDFSGWVAEYVPIALICIAKPLSE